MKTKIIAIIIILIYSISLFAQDREFIIKSAFVEKFAGFVKWPDQEELEDTPKKVIIGLYGKKPLNGNLEKIYNDQNKKIFDKDIEFRYFKEIEDLEQTHILIISNKSKEDLGDILEFTKDKPILTISDGDNFAKEGVLINFFIDNGKVRFTINEKAVHESGITMSYLLLSVAKVINRMEGE